MAIASRVRGMVGAGVSPQKPSARARLPIVSILTGNVYWANSRLTMFRADPGQAEDHFGNMNVGTPGGFSLSSIVNYVDRQWLLLVGKRV